jgi:EAL domain-containing protein (putative c-di-GMP-specific phosphodiesterase class I)
MGEVQGRTAGATTASSRALAVVLHISGKHGVAVIVGGLAFCWAVELVSGGAAVVPPHLFYIPILFAGLRFGARGSFVTALAAGILAGPLMYADVATRTAQPLSEWVARLLFFVVIGQILTAMAAIAVDGSRKELDDLDAGRALAQAMDQSRFEVYFQPIVSFTDAGRVTGAEALVRLNDPSLGVVAPDEFIPAAESTGMIRPLGEFVLRSACEQLVAWRRNGLVGADFTLSVNVSPRQLDAADFPERVAGVVRETAMDPAQLQLEITETALAEHPDQFTASLHSLRRLGVGLALDDFGTGHSTLAEVQRLPVGVIKIDRVFVTAMGDDGCAIAENVVSLARSLGLTTVAEGVETEVQADVLARMGCDRGQGFLYGRPVPGEQFALSLMAASNHRSAGEGTGTAPGTAAERTAARPTR